MLFNPLDLLPKLPDLKDIPLLGSVLKRVEKVKDAIKDTKEKGFFERILAVMGALIGIGEKKKKTTDKADTEVAEVTDEELKDAAEKVGISEGKLGENQKGSEVFAMAVAAYKANEDVASALEKASKWTDLSPENKEDSDNQIDMDGQMALGKTMIAFLLQLKKKYGTKPDDIEKALTSAKILLATSAKFKFDKFVGGMKGLFKVDALAVITNIAPRLPDGMIDVADLGKLEFFKKLKEPDCGGKKDEICEFLGQYIFSQSTKVPEVVEGINKLMTAEKGSEPFMKALAEIVAFTSENDLRRLQGFFNGGNLEKPETPWKRSEKDKTEDEDKKPESKKNGDEDEGEDAEEEPAKADEGGK